jgi:hypothetical protein
MNSFSAFAIFFFFFRVRAFVIVFVLNNASEITHSQQKNNIQSNPSSRQRQEEVQPEEQRLEVQPELKKQRLEVLK